MQIFFKIFSFCQKNGVKWREKFVNNYQQLATIILGRSTIINHYQQFARGDGVNNYRQLATICERLFKGSTIINHYQQFARDYLSCQQLAIISYDLFGKWGGTCYGAGRRT